METNQEQMQSDTEVYLAKIRRTIAESTRMVEQAELRMAETDRFLASQGLTREKVMDFKFTPQQRAAVNRELVNGGMEPLSDDEVDDPDGGWRSDISAAATPSAGDAADDVSARQQKFGMMMRQFVI